MSKTSTNREHTHTHIFIYIQVHSQNKVYFWCVALYIGTQFTMYLNSSVYHLPNIIRLIRRILLGICFCNEIYTFSLSHSSAQIFLHLLRANTFDFVYAENGNDFENRMYPNIHIHIHVTIDRDRILDGKYNMLISRNIEYSATYIDHN